MLVLEILERDKEDTVVAYTYKLDPRIPETITSLKEFNAWIENSNFKVWERVQSLNQVWFALNWVYSKNFYRFNKSAKK